MSEPAAWMVTRDSHDKPEFFATEDEACANACLGVVDAHVTPLFAHRGDLAALEAQFREKALALANDPNVQSLATYRCRAVLALHAEIEKQKGGMSKPTSEWRVTYAFNLIGAVNTVTVLSLAEMERIVLRSLTGEFDKDHLTKSFPRSDPFEKLKGGG